MDTKKVDTLLHDAAEEIRASSVMQVEVWQTIPYWTLESAGRGGWSDGWSIPYRNGLLGLDEGWPHFVFVELSTGRFVQSMKEVITDAPDSVILKAFIDTPGNFNAAQVVAARMARATNDKGSFNKEVNDRRRDEMRERYKVPMKWTEPAKPIVYAYGD